MQESGRKQLDKQMLLLGDVDYDADTESATGETEENTKSLAPWERNRNTDLVRSAEDKFSRLAGSAGEVAFIEKRYRAQPWSTPDGLMVLEGPQATEQRFRGLASQFHQLHLATHGFFAAADKRSALNPSEEEAQDGNTFSLRSSVAQLQSRSIVGFGICRCKPATTTRSGRWDPDSG